MAALVLNLFLRSAVICLAAALLRRLFPQYAARERHAILFAGFLLLLFWPLLAFVLPEVAVALPAGASADGSVTVQQSMFVSVHPLQPSNLVYLPVALWLLGVALSLLPLLLGYLKALSITRRARPLDHPAADQLLSSLCAQYGLPREPRLLVITGPLMPFLFGILKPKILISSECASWSDTRWRTVLAHELAHIQRRDVAVQMVAQFVTALWWFQPLCRLNHLALRQESERACDALALASGVKASDYAAELLDLACPSAPRRRYSSSAVMMAGRGNLEPRVQAILDSTPKRRLLPLAAAAIISLVLLTVTASALTLKEDNPMKRTLLSGLLTSAGLSAATIGGSLLDSNGAAVPNAKASLYNPDTTVAQETATATDGKFSFSVPAGQYILRIQKPGFPSLFREFNVQDDSKIDKRLAFSQPATPDGEAPHQIRVPGEAQQAKLIQKVTPVYPVSAKRAHLQGTVSLEAVISAEGVPEDITVLSSPGDDLTQSALEAVRQWRYSTTLLNGNPIAVVTNIIVNYTLTN
jgi:TonB family protein